MTNLPQVVVSNSIFSSQLLQSSEVINISLCFTSTNLSIFFLTLITTSYTSILLKTLESKIFLFVCQTYTSVYNLYQISQHSPVSFVSCKQFQIAMLVFRGLFSFVCCSCLYLVLNLTLVLSTKLPLPGWPSRGRDCDPYCLFNIVEDPEERNDLSSKLPDMLKDMVMHYQQYAKEPRDMQDQGYHSTASLPQDPNACQYMKEHGGYWQPWKQLQN